jgi:trk system potassium uptake protein TrkA
MLLMGVGALRGSCGGRIKTTMKRYGVIGLGSFGYYVAKSLYEENKEVIAIDIDKDKVQAVAPFSTDAVVLDATDKEKLRALGLDAMDAVVVSTGHKISVSILICYYLAEIGVKRILCKAEDDDHGKILKLVGANDIIHPEKDMAARIVRSLSKPNILNFIPLEKGYNIIQANAPKVFVGKSLVELDLRKKHGVHVIAIQEKGSEIIQLVPSADYMIRETDTMIIIGKDEDIEKMKEL